ncbi:glycoside hydrolase family 13 protein [Clostridium psychrophilum]|uniref:glycoside hydrolase family 13 protein n=1 Tax=Clostridium psychrophilum TaxID=132926 RepID=UPI001C0B8BD2|nr:alpha-glucosidase [Clostridium psychrophilum]MBU3182056.1 alpha-glucosidase [Clostridium psychrophilum]
MNKTWWKESVIYQIYPRSFKDSNGDGIGDLKGITQKLDYLKELGINVIWLSPIYKSPNDDNGYDISNYQDIMTEFGTMEDFDQLLQKAHDCGIKIIMDLVVNHTSNEHHWFKESRKSKDNKYRDYYIWKSGVNLQPPNNWESSFNGSAWEYDESTNMYFLHLFSKKQPDLNWENDTVRNEIYKMMKWWLNKGIDGFRMDVINLISKDQMYPDGEIRKGHSLGNFAPYSFNGPRINEFLKEMNKEVLSKYDIVTVGETPKVNIQEAMNYVDEKRNELNMVFQFELMGLGNGNHGKWSNAPFKLTDIKKIMTKWQKGLEDGGWNSLFWNNHDQPRVVSRFGNDKEYWEQSAKMLATCLHMMQGTPFIYQGEEIGMTNVAFKSIEDYRDIETINAYKEQVNIKEKNPLEMMAAINARGRDNARTPVQWDESENAGFTTGKPWIKVNPNYKQINVKSQLEEPNSIFNYYKQLIDIRSKNQIVVYGIYNLILEDNEELYAYTRTLGEEKLLIICNFVDRISKFNLPQSIKYSSQKLIIGNYKISNGVNIKSIEMKPYEARVYLLKC